MSYKAFANLKSYLEIEYIKSLTPEQINELLVRQHAEIADLKSQLAGSNDVIEDLNHQIAGFKEADAKLPPEKAPDSAMGGKCKTFPGCGCKRGDLVAGMCPIPF